ncbi:MAG: Nif11-like leader peptide family natural product precursor [Proteobacteria bacterium]|nr:Nif11-like leader peptide family natural product precursor [Pseudomonadota bacterium]
MSIESAQAFIERMKSDEEFAKNVTECKDSEARMSYVKEAGFEFTLEEVKAVSSELTDDVLDNVVGGSGTVFSIPDITAITTKTSSGGPVISYSLKPLEFIA